ncbi:hypothetical protein C8F04DRAFT_1261537 [Mycena alexandri]|uniref:Uncharacterized protein n=1 Tax=Mycena alexandri TaxID=1745969 RepID=A0AAD6X2R5_9AGAR|nr:hypothetical protein C8F04DRAFT_1261537 [Mycena alexandri]
MSSNAGPSSSSLQTPSRTTRSLPKKSPAAASAALPATGDFASPAAPRLRVGAEPVNVNTEFLQEKLSGREILARFRLQSDAPHPYPVNLQQVHNSLEHTRMVGEALADKLADLDENQPILADLRPRPVRATVAPPAPIPSPPVLPPLIPDSDAPHNPTDELDEAAEEELAEFSRRRQARFDERKALRDNYRATCERVQREHEAAFWAEQDHQQEFWESERTASLADLAAYNEERAWVVGELEFAVESRDRELVRAGRHIVRQNEIEAVTRHIYRLRDEVAYSHEMLVALQGNQTLGEEIDVFLEAAHLGEVPPGFSYRPIDPKTPYVNRPVSTSGKGKGKAVDSPEKGKGKAREVTSSTEPGKLPRVTLRLPPPPADFASVRGGGSKKRVVTEDETPERPSKVKKTGAPYDFSGKHTCNLRAAIIDFPLLATSHQPARPAGFATWTAFFQKYLRAARLLLHYGTRKAIKFPKPCVPCSKTGCPCFTDPEKTSVSCATCIVGKMKCVPSGSNTSAHIDAFLAYQHAYASHFDPVRGHLDPAFAAPFDFDKWYPPHFDYRTRAEKRKGIPFLFSKADAAKGGAVDSAEDEDEKEEEEEEEEDAMEVDDAAPPIATLSGSSESPTRSSARASAGTSKTAPRTSAPAPAAAPSSRPPVASSSRVRLEDAPLPPAEEPAPAEFTFTAATLLGGSSGHVPPHATYAERNLRARDDFSLVVPPDSCFGKLRPWNIPQEEYPLEVSVPRYHARRSWILHWAAEMDRMAIYTAGREFMAALVRDSSPSVDFPSEYLSLPIVYGNVPYPCPVPELTNDAEWRSMALYKARSFTQTILRGEGREVLSSLPSNWDTANLWGFLAKQEAQVKRELVEARLDEDPSSLFLPGGSPRETPFDADLEDRAAPVPGNAPDVPSSLPHAEQGRLREALRSAAPRHDNPWAQLALRRVLFGNPGPVLGGGLPLSYMPPTPPPLSTPPPAVRPTQDEIPYESDGRATSLAAELRSSSADGRFRPLASPAAALREDRGRGAFGDALLGWWRSRNPSSPHSGDFPCFSTNFSYRSTNFVTGTRTFDRGVVRQQPKGRYGIQRNRAVVRLVFALHCSHRLMACLDETRRLGIPTHSRFAQLGNGLASFGSTSNNSLLDDPSVYDDSYEHRTRPGWQPGTPGTLGLRGET